MQGVQAPFCIHHCCISLSPDRPLTLGQERGLLAALLWSPSDNAICTKHQAALFRMASSHPETSGTNRKDVVQMHETQRDSNSTE